MRDFARFFRTRPDDEDAERLNTINELLDFGATSYFPKFIVWLENEANRPFSIGDHMQMIQAAVRANTLREVRATLVKRVEHARAALTEKED